MLTVKTWASIFLKTSDYALSLTASSSSYLYSSAGIKISNGLGGLTFITFEDFLERGYSAGSSNFYGDSIGLNFFANMLSLSSTDLKEWSFWGLSNCYYY